MIQFITDEDQIILSYYPDFADENWIKKAFEQRERITLKKTFTLSQKHLLENYTDDPVDETEYIDDFQDEDQRSFFLFAKRKGDYYKIKKGILVNDFDIYFSKDIPFELSFFVADSKISVFGIFSEITKDDIYIGGDHENAVPESSFRQLITHFPNSYEKKKYVEARVSTVLKNYLNNVKDSGAAYQKYMNNRPSIKGSDLKNDLHQSELIKYTALFTKLEMMLAAEMSYSERQWQEEILQIITLIYPKYIHVFKDVPVKADNIKDKFLDFLLVDSDGFVDIIEIKKPFENSIMTGTTYRNNYIPLRELSGTIMQLEKYIYFLNRWGATGEKVLTEKYGDQLTPGFKIKVTNPSGIILLGRDNNLTTDQKADFEVVKRKYKNVADIMTYDNLLQRLRSTIEQLRIRDMPF
jgi:hypothetical protein